LRYKSVVKIPSADNCFWSQVSTAAFSCGHPKKGNNGLGMNGHCTNSPFTAIYCPALYCSAGEGTIHALDSTHTKSTRTLTSCTDPKTRTIHSKPFKLSQDRKALENR